MSAMKHNLNPTNQPWSKYRTQAVRDLVWSCSSPALMTAGIGGHPCLDNLFTATAHHWLTRLDQNPGELLDHLSAVKSPRLGFYFEQLLAFTFTAGYQAAATPYRLKARNLPIRRGGSTLGELDFLLEDPRGQLLHLEVAVKFYLGRGDVADADLEHWHHWLGPSARDRLDIKLERMFGHQLAVAQTSEARSALQIHLEQGQPITSAYCLRGILFYPYTQAQTGCVPPRTAGAGHQAGYWTPQNRLPEALQIFEAVDRWVPLTRSEWLSGAPTDLSHERGVTAAMLGAGAISSSVETSQRAQMLQGLCKTDGELVRLMLVPSYWPTTNSPSRKM